MFCSGWLEQGQASRWITYTQYSTVKCGKSVDVLSKNLLSFADYTARGVHGTTNLKYLLLEHKSFVTLEEE